MSNYFVEQASEMLTQKSLSGNSLSRSKLQLVSWKDLFAKFKNKLENVLGFEEIDKKFKEDTLLLTATFGKLQA